MEYYGLKKDKNILLRCLGDGSFKVSWSLSLLLAFNCIPILVLGHSHVIMFGVDIKENYIAHYPHTRAHTYLHT